MEESQVYTIPVKAIKSLLKKELESFRSGFMNHTGKRLLADVQIEAGRMGFAMMEDQLLKAEDYEDLENYIGNVGYRMSLQHWIDSL